MSLKSDNPGKAVGLMSGACAAQKLVHGQQLLTTENTSAVDYRVLTCQELSGLVYNTRGLRARLSIRSPSYFSEVPSGFVVWVSRGGRFGK